MIGAIIFLIMLFLCIFSMYMAGSEESIGWWIISAISFIGIFFGMSIATPPDNTKQDMQYQKDILELKLLEQRIELFDLQIEQLKLNINQK